MLNILRLQKLSGKHNLVHPENMFASTFSQICPTHTPNDVANPFEME